MSTLSLLAPRPTQADALGPTGWARARGGDPRGGDPRGTHPRGTPTLLCASGRGGAGTSLVSALLAVVAAGEGVQVLLVDADDFVGPLAILLGCTPGASWLDLRGGRMGVADVITPVSTTLTLVAGGPPRATPAGGALSPAERRACLQRVGELAATADLVVVDAGARLDPLVAAITPHADERLVAVSGSSDPVGLAASYALCKAARERHPALPIDLLVNRESGTEASRLFDRVNAGTRQFLDTTLHYGGAIPADPTLDAALRAGIPFPEAAAGSPAALAAQALVRRALSGATSTRSGS